MANATLNFTLKRRSTVKCIFLQKKVIPPGFEPGPKEPESLILSIRLRDHFSGAGGSRTLVQTRNNYAFYILILLLVFELCKETDILIATLSP